MWHRPFVAACGHFIWYGDFGYLSAVSHVTRINIMWLLIVTNDELDYSFISSSNLIGFFCLWSYGTMDLYGAMVFRWSIVRISRDSFSTLLCSFSSLGCTTALSGLTFLFTLGVTA